MTTKTKPVRKAKATKTITRPYDVAEHLRTPKEMALYLDACIAESDGDPAFIAKALGDVARAKGMAALAKETGLGRESLYKTLSSSGNPELGTVLKVTRALGVRMSFSLA
jgi:probable addiction module antidote protein